MSNSRSEKNTSSAAPRLSPVDIYIWAIHGPFKSGYQSALTMAKVIYARGGDERLKELEKGIITHEEKYNLDRDAWEKWRKEFIRNNLLKIGSNKSDEIKKIENSIENLSDNHSCIQRIEKQLSIPKDDPSEMEHQTYKNKEELGLYPYQDYHSNTKIAEQHRGLPNKKKDQKNWPADILIKVKDIFLGVSGGLTALVYIGIFFTVWGMLISRDLILGLSLGWIPATLTVIILT